MKSRKVSPKQAAVLQHAIDLHNQGRLGEADEIYRKFLRDVPNHPDALHLRALVAHATGNFPDAARFAEAAIALAPGIANFHNTAGEAWRRQRQTVQALKRLTEAIKLNPAFAMAHHNLSLALCDEARYAQALASSRQALALNPSYVEARVACLDILALLGDLDPGEAEAEILARVRGDRMACDAAAKYYTRRARARFQQLQFEQGRAEGVKALAASPGFWGGWAILAEAGNELSDGHSAELYCSIAANLAPDNKDARLNLAHLLREQQRLPEAGSHYSAWLKDHPADANAHFGMAWVHLARGNYAEAWPEYEHRWGIAGEARKFDKVPQWTGGASGHLLLCPEQGLGDFLQMLRFIPEAALCCKGRMTVLTPAPLLSLVRRNLPGAISMVSELPPESNFDHACPVMSLPYVLGIDSADRIASPLPYVAADLQRQRYFQNALSKLPGKKLGIVWRGATGGAFNRRRALPDSALQTLLMLPGWTPVSLQFGVKAPTIGAKRLVDLSEDIKDFDDLAAAMQAVDVVVSLDTGPAHLAGAMGLRSYTLVPRLHDWRWGTEGTGCDWYSNMVLLRQLEPDSWEVPIKSLARTLAGANAAPPIDAPPALAGAIRKNDFPFIHVSGRHGMVVAPLVDQYITRSLLLYGEYSPREAAVLTSYLRPGDTALDVGANLGTLTLPMATAVGPRGRIIAFEPQGVIYGCLSETLVQNRVEQVELRHLAVGAQAGRAMVPRLDAAQAGDFRRASLHQQQECDQVDVIALDGLDLASCRLIRIDVAGGEEDVLRGARALIDRLKPVVSIRADGPGAAGKLTGILKGWGYGVFKYQAPLFSGNNYRKCQYDVFPGAVSVNVLALPAGETPPPDAEAVHEV